MKKEHIQFWLEWILIFGIVLYFAIASFAHATVWTDANIMYTNNQYAEAVTYTNGEGSTTSTFKTFKFPKSGYAKEIYVVGFTGCSQNNFGTWTLWNTSQNKLEATSSNILSGNGGQAFTTFPQINTTDYYTLSVLNTNGLNNGNNLCVGTQTLTPYKPELGGITIWGDNITIIPPEGYIEITQPYTSGTFTGDISQWNVYANITLPNPAYLEIHYSSSTSNLDSTSSEVYAESILVTGTPEHPTFLNEILPIYHGEAVHSPSLEYGLSRSNPQQNWYAKAYLIGTDGVIYSSSTQISFTIQYKIETSDKRPCSEKYPDAVSWERLGCILTQPSEEMQNRMEKEIKNFQSFFPFNIFYNFNTIAEETLRNYNNQSQTLSLPLLVSSGTATIFSSDTLSAFVGETNKNTIFKLQEMMTWFAVGWWIYQIVVKKQK